MPPISSGDPPERALTVVATGALTTVQDLGRPGLAGLGVGRSGAADLQSLRLANRLVGNPEDSAALEVTNGGLVVRARGGLTVAVTGAPCLVAVDGRQLSSYASVWVPDGAELALGTPLSGLRSYVAVRGGLDVPPVLGSRSTDTLAGLGPDPLLPGSRISVAVARGVQRGIDCAPASMPAPPAEDVWLRVLPGPRAAWFTGAALEALLASPYDVTADSDRIGMRLSGTALERRRDEELPSEGMVPGALQVPPTGQPTLLLADHPVTGGYPVIAVVRSGDLGKAAQARPGQRLRFRTA